MTIQHRIFSGIRALCCALLLGGLWGCTQTANRVSEQGDNDFKIIGYVSFHQGDYLSSIKSHIPYVTHLNVAFANPTGAATGELQPINDELLHNTMRLARKHNKQVFISFGGWRGDDDGYDLVYEKIVANDTARQNFIDNIVAMVERFDFDGVDMDWEYPRAQSAADYERFIVELSDALHQNGKQLTAAVIATKTKVTDSGDASSYTDRALAAFDWINLMAYDDRPDNHTPYDLVNRSTDYWLGERGLAPQKVVLGLAAYARPSLRSYRQLVDLNPDLACVDETQFEGRVDYYNGLPTIAKKTEFARKQQLGGVMVWALRLDSTTPSLSIMQTIDATVNNQHIASYCQR